MERLTHRIDNVPDGESGVWVKNRDYVSAAEKLAEYEDLEEQDRLIKLPCKVGDKVYRIRKKESVIEMRVLQIYCRKNCDGKTRIWFDTIHIDNNEFENSYFVEDIGKTVFLTKSEAEEKLKELHKLEELRGGENESNN